MPVITIEGGRAAENGFVVFTLRLSEPAPDAVTVDYATFSGTAARDFDIRQWGSNALDGQVTFEIGELVQTIAIYVGSEQDDELDESFFVELRNPDGATFGNNIHSLTATGWALDNDGAGNNRAIAVSDAVISEGAGGKAVFTISLSQAFADDRSFSFSTFNDSARAGSDFVARTGTVTFLAGQTEATVEVDLMNNRLAEATERFGLAITGAHGVTGTTGTAVIVDDDSARPVLSIEGGRAPENGFVYFTLRLSEAATDAVTVDYATFSGTAARDFDIRQWGSNALDGQVTFEIGELVKTIAIYVGSEQDDELDESFFVELRNPDGATFGNNIHSLTATGWALDNDGAGNNRAIAVSDAVISEGAGGKAVFTISLSQAFADDRSFSFSTFNGSAKAGSDFVARTGTVTFLAGQTEATVEVDLINDSLAEATEGFGLAITGAHGVTGTTGTAVIVDDDSARPVLSIEGSGAPENGFVYFTLRLSEAATDAVTVDYATFSGTAVRDVDIRQWGSNALDGQVTFEIGDLVKTIAIYVGSEREDELDESFFVELRNPSGAVFGGGNNTLVATGWARDDDGPGLNRTVAVSGADVREGPGGRVAVFAVEISTAHDAPLTLNYQTVNGTALAGQDYAAAAGRITFAAGQTRVEISVPIHNDLDLEATEHFFLRVAPPFPSPISALSSVATGRATITDGSLRGTAGNNVIRGTDAAEAIAGLGGNDQLFGLGGNDRIWGDAGNDTLLGGVGADTMIGGVGNDFYHIDAFDTVIEAAGGGIDTIHAGFSYRLGANVENLLLVGAANINGTGNALNNVLTGNAGVNVLSGGLGNDTYVIGAGDRVIEAVGAGIDTVRSSVTHFLSANVENLVLVGTANINGTGNALNNVLSGNAGINALAGGLGNDTYVIGAGDRVFEGVGGGIDTVRSSVTHFLSANVENLVLVGTANINGTGNALNNVLSGNAGINALAGGLGNDTYVIGAGDRVFEGVGGGIDTVRSSVTHALSANVEHLTLLGAGNINGTGNALANRLTGNAGANVLNGGAGADVLFGGAGADVLNGGVDSNRDVFLFTQLSDFGTGGAMDQIIGFVRGIDDIDMSVIDANSRVAGVQDFVFSGMAARAHAVWYVQQGANLVVRGDHNGDGNADFSFMVRNASGLGAGDFIF